MRDSKDVELDRILDLKQLKLPKVPRVVDIRSKRGIDSTGDEAVWVWLILDDATTKANWQFAKVKPLLDAVHDAVTGSSLGIWPYVAARSKSEQDEIDAIEAN